MNKKEERQMIIVWAIITIIVDVSFLLGLIYYYNRWKTHQSGFVSVGVLLICLFIFNKRVVKDYILKMIKDKKNNRG